MSRRIFNTKEDIFRKRAYWWAEHYQKREQAKAFPHESATRTLKALEQMPEPALDFTGATSDDYVYRAIDFQEKVWLLKQAGTPSELFVKWYWSEQEWMSFVRQFNALAEPEPLYEVISDPPFLKVVPEGLWISRVQVKYKSEVVPIKKEKSR